MARQQHQSVERLHRRVPAGVARHLHHGIHVWQFVLDGKLLIPDADNQSQLFQQFFFLLLCNQLGKLPQLLVTDVLLI